MKSTRLTAGGLELVIRNGRLPPRAHPAVVAGDPRGVEWLVAKLLKALAYPSTSNAVFIFTPITAAKSEENETSSCKKEAEQAC